MSKQSHHCKFLAVAFLAVEAHLVAAALSVHFSPAGDVAAISAADGRMQPIGTTVALPGCAVTSVRRTDQADGGVQFEKTVTGADRTVRLTERFTPTPTSLRWEVTLWDDGPYWSVPIGMGLKYPRSLHTRFWTAWGDPRGDVVGAKYDNEAIANAQIWEVAKTGSDWQDPLVATPLRQALFHYGAPVYTYDNPRTAFCPFQGDLFCIPLAVLLEPDAKSGLSLVLSPEDLLLDLTLQITESGGVTFTHLNHRMGMGRTVKFSLDLVPHAADWRAALGWVVRRYPAYFNPVAPGADDVAGTGAYSRTWMDFDVEKMRRMAFGVNWKASFDFPYMGLFLPPVDDRTPWRGYRPRKDDPPTSIPRMRDYSRQMRALGFHCLNYFNVTEFGADIKYPAPPRQAQSDEDLWREANDFLYAKLVDAILYTPPQQRIFDSKHYGRTEPNRPFWTWGKGIVMDPGEPVYREFLLDQARRHVELLPDSSGICIDRMDWLRMYNHRRDDGVSWMGGQPVRSLYVSWLDLLAKLGPVFHDRGKVVFVNNHIKRLEQMRQVDGIFDEFTYGGSPLNTIAVLGVRKPVLGWISRAEQFQPDPDWAIQKFIYLGVFPMAPFPANDHSLQPGAWVDRLYLDYGPLLRQLKGKKWVLEPGAIAVSGGPARANLFEVNAGYVVPVVFAGEAASVTVTLDPTALRARRFDATAIHPGSETETPVRQALVEGRLQLQVPVKRGCALLVLRQPRN